MSVASYIGDTTFRTVSETESTAHNGMDTITMVRKGRRSLLSAEKALYPKGKVHPSESSMFVSTKTSRDSGNYATLEINYIGFLGEADAENGLVSVSSNINAQTVTLTTDTDEVVDFSYYARSATWRWVHRGYNAPTSPRFPMVIDSSIGVGNLFDPNPPNYTGSVDKKLVARLEGFNPERLAPGVWAVTESWIQKIEANKTIT